MNTMSIGHDKDNDDFITTTTTMHPRIIANTTQRRAATTKPTLAKRSKERRACTCCPLLGRGVFVVFFLYSISTPFLSEQRAVDAFRAVGLGGGFESKQKHQQQQHQRYTRTTATFLSSIESAARIQSNGVRLKLAKDKSSGESASVSANNNNDDIVETKTTPVTDIDVSVNNSTTSSSSSQFMMNFNASGSIGSLLMQMQKKETELRQLNKSASLLLSEGQALKLDTDQTSFRSISTRTTTTTKTNVNADANANANANGAATAAAPKKDIFSWMRKTDGDIKNEGLVDGNAPGADSATGSQTAMASEILARELDDSVSIRITNSLKDVTLLEPPDIYRIIQPRTTTTKTDDVTDTIQIPSSLALVLEEEKKTDTSSMDNTSTKDNLPPLSRAEHYEGRIGRDMRHLSVSIASCIDSVEEWQLFCQQTTGGLEPLIECIREGAKSIREGSASSKSTSDHQYLTSSTYSSGFSNKEENFQAASGACRAIRDLCALSLDLASVITDGLLRANAAYKEKGEYTLMDDLCTILRHDDELSDLHHQLTDKVAPTKRRRRGLLSFLGRNRQQEGQATSPSSSSPSKSNKWPMGIFRERREARLLWKLYVTQLLLATTCASDCAVDAIRATEGLQDVLLVYSSYAPKERRRRWMRYPGEKIKSMWLKKRRRRQKDSPASTSQETTEQRRRPFIEAASVKDNLNGRIQGTTNQVLAAIGYNEWVPKIPGQKGLRILCLDGGGSRGMTSVVAMKCLVDSLGGMEVADCFDLVVGTSTGAIIAFLVGLNRETSEQAVERYDVLIEKIFTKSAFSTPMLLFTTASYDESPFMNVLTDILKDSTMLDSRENPAVPLVFAVTSKMSSNPTHIALFRNYNYNGGELPDPFMIDPDDARKNLDLPLKNEAKIIRMNHYPKKTDCMQPAPGAGKPDNGSRHPGSFRVLQKYALRASTAAPTVFKPVLMGGEMYCDGGIVASNPSAIAIHEARRIFPDVPIELVVSIGTGGFKEQKSAPRIGWDGIIGQIINSATDGEQIHHILEDVLGDGTTAQGRSSVSDTCYMRFNPTLGMPDEFPIGKPLQIKLL
uniref:PNPLA domain-containing protein n=1 Tax=Pseudo-nitzschia australis TaxID=44445 RepID=A0A7S4AE78_9STRA